MAEARRETAALEGLIMARREGLCDARAERAIDLDLGFDLGLEVAALMGWAAAMGPNMVELFLGGMRCVGCDSRGLARAGS